GFISKMIDQVKAKYSVDSKRIYATGISNGGVMAYLTGCELSDKVAAVAPVAPPGIPSVCSTAKPVSILHVHGTGDLFAKYDGGKGGTLFANLPGACFQLNHGNARGPCTVEPTEEQVDFWIKKNRCPTIPKVVYQKGAAKCLSYGPCDGDTDIEFCKIVG